MLTKDNSNLFKNPNFEKNKNETSSNRTSKNIINHNDCILQLDKLYEKIKNKEKDLISYKNKYDNLKYDYNHLENKFIESCNNENVLYLENKMLKNQINMFNNINKNIFINDDIMNIDLDIFEYESDYILKKKVISYERQIDYINTFFNYNNVSNLEELTKIVKFYRNNNKNHDHENKDIESDNKTINPIKKLMSKEEINQIQKQFSNSLKNIKDKLKRIKEGDVITIKGIERKAIFIDNKLKFYKIEKVISKIKMVEEEFNSYCKKQISLAKNILGNDYDDIKIIRLLDIYNKIINDNTSSSDSESNSDNKYYNILNKNKNVKLLEFQTYSELGNQFINDNINSRKDLTKDNLIFIKEIIKTSDINGTKDDKFNRFINQCKRYYILSQKMKNHNNIIKSKCKTSIRDMNNKDFDDLVKLIDNINKKE